MTYRRVEKQSSRNAHNVENAGANPAPATTFLCDLEPDDPQHDEGCPCDDCREDAYREAMDAAERAERRHVHDVEEER